ncbi:MAG: hypothetical protein KC776_15215 [Myxococcales bacterium]|nr:hypothetical protein [Myxococcales bacterium]
MSLRFSTLALLVATLWTTPGLADDTCLSSYDSSQRLRREGKLLDAKQALLTCAQESCPAPVAKECTRWLREVSDSVPTVVFGAQDADGRDVLDVVVLDGDTEIQDRLDGRAVPVDPGAHRFRFVFADGKQVILQVLVREAEKNRALTARHPPAPTGARRPAKKPAHRGLPPPPAASWALGALGVVGLASFGYFALDAKATKDDLESSCAPNCTTDETAPLRHKALAADISLAVGVAALAGGTWLWLSYDPDTSSAARLSVAAGGRF